MLWLCRFWNTTSARSFSNPESELSGCLEIHSDQHFLGLFLDQKFFLALKHKVIAYIRQLNLPFFFFLQFVFLIKEQAFLLNACYKPALY